MRFFKSKIENEQNRYIPYGSRTVRSGADLKRVTGTFNKLVYIHVSSSKASWDENTYTQLSMNDGEWRASTSVIKRRQ